MVWILPSRILFSQIGACEKVTLLWSGRAFGYSSSMAYRFGEFELEISSLELRARDSVLPVAPKVFDVLAYLLRNRGRVVSRKELLDAVWPGLSVSPNSLNQAITAIRRVLHDDDESYVRTVHSRGYRFIAPVEQQPDSSRSIDETAPEHG